jgi:aldose 1-epimerase
MQLANLRQWCLASLLTVTIASLAAAQPYSASQDGDVVQLQDSRSQTVVSILTSVGNIAFELKVKGHNVLRWPYSSLDEFKSRPGMNGIPFMGPWANRLDEQAFYANGKKYAFDMELGNVRGAIPIHGFLTTNTEWKVVEARADAKSAWVTSRLEFFRNPMWMAQFPFAHTIEMTYRLQDGVLEVATRIENLSIEPMPVAIGYHPYFQLTDSKRDEWTISVGAKTEWLLAPNKIPTGGTRPIESFLPDPKNAVLKDYDLDHVFGDLIRDGSGRAVMTVKGKSQQLDVAVGPNYRAMVIYAPSPAAASGRGGTPQDRNFICFEPMAGITDSMNLAQKGLYKELQSIPPGKTWQESFWIRVQGFQ